MWRAEAPTVVVMVKAQDVDSSDQGCSNPETRVPVRVVERRGLFIVGHKGRVSGGIRLLLAVGDHAA